MKKILLIVFFGLIFYGILLGILSFPSGVSGSSKWRITSFELTTTSARIGDSVTATVKIRSEMLDTKECVNLVVKMQDQPIRSVECCATDVGYLPGINTIIYGGTCESGFPFKIKLPTGISPVAESFDVKITAMITKSIPAIPVAEKEMVIRINNTIIPLPPEPSNINPISITSVIPFVEHITNIVFWLVSSFAFVMILIGGFMMTTSGGDPRKITKGRNTIFFAIAGFAIMSLSKGIVSLIQAIMGVRK